MLALLDENLNLAPERDIDDFLHSVIVAPKEVGLKYHVVGILGGQSSGKSTLMNHVFGTTFLMMDADLGRQQTTKGAHLSHAKFGENIFVIDFEGSDGAERGEDQQFERKLSLFALAVTDLLMINMWSQEVGRFNAANLSLLRTVFEVHLQLFHSDRPKTLLFVLRDHTDGSFEKLCETLKRSLRSIWEKVHNPDAVTLESVFHLRFFAMPHFTLQREQFKSAVVDLRRLFLDTPSVHQDEGELPILSASQTIPLESFSLFAANCWKVIRDNRELNVPSQRHLVSTLRCGQALNEIIDRFTDQISQYEASLKRRICVAKLPELCNVLMNELLEELQRSISLYDTDVTTGTREKFLSTCEQKFAALAEMQRTNLVLELLTQMESEVLARADHAVNHYMARTSFWSSLRAMILEQVETAIQRCKGQYLEYIDPSRDLNQLQRDIMDGARKILVTRIRGIAHDCLVHMTKNFDQTFHKDPTGKLRHFKSEASIDLAFEPSYEQGLQVLNALFYSRMDDDDDEVNLSVTREELPSFPKKYDEEKVILTQTEVKHIIEMYQQQCNFTLMLQRKNVALQRSGTSPLFWIMAIGCLNELYYFLTSPVLLTLVAVVSYFFLKDTIITQWEQFLDNGPRWLTMPAQAVVTGVVRRFGDARLRNDRPPSKRSD